MTKEEKENKKEESKEKKGTGSCETKPVAALTLRYKRYSSVLHHQITTNTIKDFRPGLKDFELK